MKRIVSFGCSHTYGQGLSDCLHTSMETPSQFAWPKLLADLLGYEHLNLAVPGAGNKLILHQISNFEFDSNDICVVLWSHINRRHFFKNSQDRVDINQWCDTKTSRSFYKMYSFAYDELYESAMFANYARYDLGARSVPYYYCFADSEMHLDPNAVRCSRYLDIDFSTYRNQFRRALDGLHMGQAGQEHFAKQWYELILAHTNCSSSCSH